MGDIPEIEIKLQKLNSVLKPKTIYKLDLVKNDEAFYKDDFLRNIFQEMFNQDVEFSHFIVEPYSVVTTTSSGFDLSESEEERTRLNINLYVRTKVFKKFLLESMAIKLLEAGFLKKEQDNVEIAKILLVS